MALVINPVARLILSSFEKPDAGGFTLDNYGSAYGRWRHVQALINTLVMGAGAALLAAALAVPLAWACVRTDMPGRGFIRLAVLAAFIMPPYLGAVGWILLAGPNAGWINKVWMWATGAPSGIVNVFSLGGLILIIGLHSLFYVFVFTSSALELVSSEMEDAANVLGAGPMKTAFKVTLPLVYPAIIGSTIVVFLQAIALVRRARHDRHSRALSRRRHAALAVLRASRAGRSRRGLFVASARRDDLAARPAERPVGAQRLHDGRRQGRRAARRQARPLALGHVCLRVAAWRARPC